MAYYSDLTIPDEAIPGARPGEYFMCCPKCEERVGKVDTGFHMGVSMNKGVFNCFRCGFKGPVRALEILMLAFEDPEKYEHNSKVDNLRKKLSSVTERNYNITEIITEINLDQFSDPMTKMDTPIAYSYMIDRGFSPGEIYKLKLRVGKEYKDELDNRTVKKWRGRVIFPFYSNGICDYVIGRSYTDHTPKYLNIVRDKRSVIYNIESVKNQEPCIICEGIISAISAQRYTKVPAVAILGKFISDEQIERIRNVTNKVYFSLDGDLSRKEVVKNIKKLLRSGFRVEYVRLPEGKDPDDLKENYKKYFDGSVSPFFI